MNNGTSRIKAVIYALPGDLAGELQKALNPLCACLSVRDLTTVDAPVIFTSPVRRTIAELRRLRPDAAIIAVSECTDMKKWLDAMEAGASDYCAAPFDTAHLEWLVAGPQTAASAA